MPKMSIPMYEAFAQLLAQGVPEERAVLQAGFRSQMALEGIKDGKYWPAIQDRVVAIRGEKGIAVVDDDTVEPNLSPAKMTPDRIMTEAWRMYGKAVKSKAIKPALAALELIGRGKGMFIQKREVTVTSITQMSDEQIQALLLELPETEFEDVTPPPKGFAAAKG